MAMADLGGPKRGGRHPDPGATIEGESDTPRIVGRSLDPFGEVVLEGVELTAIQDVGRTGLVQLVDRPPMTGAIADPGHGREFDPGLPTAAQVRLEPGFVERVQIELEPNPLDAQEHSFSAVPAEGSRAQRQNGLNDGLAGPSRSNACLTHCRAG